MIHVFDYETGEFLQSFDNPHGAANTLGLDDGNIHRVLKGSRNHTGGFYFVFKQGALTERMKSLVKKKILWYKKLSLKNEIDGLLAES